MASDSIGYWYRQPFTITALSQHIAIAMVVWFEDISNVTGITVTWSFSCIHVTLRITLLKIYLFVTFLENLNNSNQTKAMLLLNLVG